MKTLRAVLPLILVLTACDRHEAPSEQLAKSAEQLVGAKEPEPAPLADGPFAPRDTCGDLEGADAFRQSLAEAVEARDVDGFLALAAEDIKLDFGGGAGRAELKQRLTGKDWKLWDEFDALLALGCAANKQGGITIPWYFEQHIDKVDPMAGMIDAAPDAESMAQLPGMVGLTNEPLFYTGLALLFGSFGLGWWRRRRDVCQPLHPLRAMRAAFARRF